MERGGDCLVPLQTTPRKEDGGKWEADKSTVPTRHGKTQGHPVNPPGTAENVQAKQNKARDDQPRNLADELHLKWLRVLASDVRACRLRFYMKASSHTRM
jgi:hypothetical protein